jgi:anti-anti-sigma regulatory factor
MTAVDRDISFSSANDLGSVVCELLPDGAAVADQGISGLSVGRNDLGLFIAGEVDESSYRFFAETLNALASGLSLVRINLAGLTYCDVAGLRLIVGLAGTGGLDGDHAGARPVVLCGTAPHLKTVLGILGWDRTPGLVVD